MDTRLLKSTFDQLELELATLAALVGYTKWNLWILKLVLYKWKAFALEFN